MGMVEPLVVMDGREREKKRTEFKHIYREREIKAIYRIYVSDYACNVLCVQGTFVHLTNGKLCAFNTKRSQLTHLNKMVVFLKRLILQQMNAKHFIPHMMKCDFFLLFCLSITNRLPRSEGRQHGKVFYH